MKKKILKAVFPLLLSISIVFSGCGKTETENNPNAVGSEETTTDYEQAIDFTEHETDDTVEENQNASSKYEPVISGHDDELENIGEDLDTDTSKNTYNDDISSTSAVAIYNVPEYSSEPYATVNNNEPFFESYEYTTDPFEYYSSLDELGRCSVAYANICKELMPTEERESISSVKPTGWHNYSYDIVDGGYIYNRCHLIAYELAGENANEMNLITGTRYFNVDGMLPFENMVADYVRETDNHVLYRVTPVFDGDNLVADGVLMEAYSVEDDGEGIEFCVFCYNVQPGITIDYATGENWETNPNMTVSENIYNVEEYVYPETSIGDEEEYILNVNSMKFHRPTCTSISSINENNKKEYYGTREELLDQGYEPCGSCKP